MRFSSRSLSLGLSLGLAITAAAAPIPADTVRMAKHRHADQSRTGPEICRSPLSRQLDWLGDSSVVAPATYPTPTPRSVPKGTATPRSLRAQARAIAQERVRQGWGNQRWE